MKITHLNISELCVIEPNTFEDSRGSFRETYNKSVFKRQGIGVNFVQDNLSVSHKHVVRGLHFQREPHAQAKLVTVLQGAVLDYAVDIRLGSPTFGRWEEVLLTADNRMLFYIPAGFAHGFVSLEDNTIFSYKCSDTYHKASEGGIIWNDSTLKISWGVESHGVTTPIISDKDAVLPAFIDSGN